MRSTIQPGIMPPESISFRELQKATHSRGIEVLSVLRDISGRSKDQNALQRWISHGFHGEMSYLERLSDAFSEKETILAGLRSIAVFAVPYPAERKCERGHGEARISRYALGRDYHRVLKRTLAKVLIDLGLPKNSFRIVTDSFPLLERSIAQQAGVGFVGKNTMLIRPRLGSYFFLAEALLTFTVEDLPIPVLKGDCGSCSRCLEACPTKAFVSPYVLNATRCISYLTIEKRGRFSAWERRAIGEWGFGCDICQEVCPFNHRRGTQETEDFLAEFQFQSRKLPLSEILSIRTKEQFVERFSGTPLMRAKREGLLRNMCCVAANTLDISALPALLEAALCDSSDNIRGHAVWAIGKLSDLLVSEERANAREALRSRLKYETPFVRGELFWCLPRLASASEENY
ncbi:MAG: tRNA epoxyqueuosine(34) reductase QueG [Bdellovibrionales bacterium]|nr:tRNA epoxyqueuosine(34) reductase QueG [Bdellovibrionales bacterium]